MSFQDYLEKKKAQLIALGLEYNWQSASSYLPATYARRYIVKTRRFLMAMNAVIDSATGRENLWEEVLTIKTEFSAEELLKQLNNYLLTEAKWTKGNLGREDTKTSQWKFSGENGEPWNGTVNIRTDANEKKKLIITLKIVRLT